MKKSIFSRGLLSILGFLMYLMPNVVFSQPGNIAPQATVTAAGGGAAGCQTGPCSTLNDLVLGTCGTQQMWINTGGTPTTALGVDWIQWDFPSVKTFDTLIIHHGSATTRFLTGATVQYWDGSAWVTHMSFSGLPMQCINKIPIGVLATDRFRITGFIPGTGQLSNQNFREIEIIAASTGTNDAAVLSVDSPKVYCAGTENVLVTIANLGVNQLDSVDVAWEVNGVAQPSIRYVGLLDTASGPLPYTAQVNLGTFNFPVGASTVKAWTFNPNGGADTSNFNDTNITGIQTAANPPQAMVTSASLTTADATIGNANGIDYVIVPFGSPAASGTPVANVNSPFTATGLTPSTTYDMYVRKNCGGGDVSAWVGPTTFNTAYAVPFAQDYENWTSGLQGNSFPEGWSQRPGTASYNMWRSQQANGNNTNSGGTGPLWDHTFFGGPTGGLYMYMETSTSTTGDTVDLYSPPIYIDSVLTTVELGYWYFNFGTNIDKMEVLVDSNGVENLLATYTGQQQTAQTDPWLFASHFLNGYNGKSVTLIFRGYGVPCCSGDIAVDDITIDPVLPLDAGVTDVISPSGSLCPGTITPIVEVRNYGSTQLDSVEIYWDVNGVLDSTTYIGTVAPGATFNATLGTLNINSTTVYDIDIYTGDINGQADQFGGNDTLRLNGLRTGLNGTVTLDPALPASATNFVDFASLSNTLNNYGVCGNAVVNIANGTYTNPLVLDNIPGLSATNTLTLDGGDSSLTIITHDGTSNFSTLELNGVSYVTVQNLTVQNTNSGNGAAILLTGETNFNTIRNCEVKYNTSTTFFGTAAITLSGSSTSATQTPGGRARGNTIENNRIIGGNHGVRMYGDFNNVVQIENKVMNNLIDSTWTYGAYIYYQDSAEFIGNTVLASSRGNAFGDGVFMFANNNGKVNNNYVESQDWTFYWSNTNILTQNQLARRNEVINNMFISGTDYGVYLNGVDSLDFWHNSVNALGSSPALFINTFGNYNLGDWDLRNNVLQSASGVALDIGGTTDTIFNKMDNNVYNTVSGVNLIDINNTTYANLAAYQTAQPLLNSSSLEGDPQFTTPTDLHIIGAFINDSADASVPVVIDIDGDVRPAVGSAGPDPGADEYNPPTCPPAANLTSRNSTLDSATIAWSTTLVGVSFEYVYVLAGQPQTSGTIMNTTADTARLGGLTASTGYEFYVRIVCGRGDTSIWMGPQAFRTANGVPYFQDFEAWTNPNFSGLINEEGWYTLGTPTPHWEVNSTTSSGSTGPIGDHTIGAGGTFTYLECSGGTTGDTDTLWSAPIYFDPTQNAVSLEFWYHMYGSAMGSLEVYSLANGVMSPVLVNLVGQQQTAQNDPWLQATANIGGLGGQTVQLVFTGIRGTSFTSDMAIDDVRLFIPAPIDGGVTDIISPTSGCGLGTDTVTVEITNFGTGDLTNFPVQYTVNGGTPVIETITDTVFTGTTYNYQFTTTVNLSTSGTYTIAAQTNLTSDGDLTNDADTSTIESIPLIGSPATTFYVEDFENGSGGWTTNTLWALGAPNGTVISTAGSGSNSWVTNLNGNYGVDNTDAYLNSPCFDFTGATNPAIEFHAFWHSEATWDGSNLESSIDGGATWQTVGAVGDTVNWYTGNVFALGGDGWEGTALTNWVVSAHDLFSLANQSSVLLRFHFASDASVNNYEGLGIDNVKIYNNINVGIEDQVANNAPAFSLSPNPSNGEFNLNIRSEQSEQMQLTIRDMEGKLVYNEALNVNGNFNKTMNLSELSKGVYFLRLQNDKESKVEKLIIQ